MSRLAYRAVLAGLLACAAVPALAQYGGGYGGWNTQTFGNQTYSYGQGNMQGWTGNSQTFGNQTYNNFQGPNGQMKRCTTQAFGNQTYTNCY